MPSPVFSGVHDSILVNAGYLYVVGTGSNDNLIQSGGSSVGNVTVSELDFTEDAVIVPVP